MCVYDGHIGGTVIFPRILGHLTGTFEGLIDIIAIRPSLDDDIHNPFQHSPKVGEHDHNGNELLRDHCKFVPHADNAQGPPLNEKGGHKQTHKICRLVGRTESLSLVLEHGFDSLRICVDFPPCQHVKYHICD